MTASIEIIDLHSHSLASDGQYPAAQVAELAAAAGLSVWALTDHDSIAALSAASQAATSRGVRFVPGIELSVFLENREVHLLGHFVEPGSPTLCEFEDLLAEKRRERLNEMVAKLGTLGFALAIDDIEKFSGGKTLARPHVARALQEKGFVSSVKEAFDLFLGDGRPAYVPRFRMTVREAIDLVRRSGGTPTIAHPGQNGLERGDLARMRDWGLEGLEVHHPEHVPSLREKLLRIAKELDLVPTAGSDFHGEAVAPRRRFGQETMKVEDLARLEERRG